MLCRATFILIENVTYIYTFASEEITNKANVSKFDSVEI